MLFHRYRMYNWFAKQCRLANDRPWLLSIIGSVPIILISTPELFEDVMKPQFDVFAKDQEAVFFIGFFGKGILAADDDVWYFHRKTVSNLFSNQMMRDVMYTAVEDKVKTLCESLRTYESRGEPVSFKNVITQFTSDVFGKIGFGVDLNCLQNGVAGTKGNEFVEAFQQAAQVVFLRFVQPEWLWRVKRVLNVGSEKLLRESIQVINGFIFRILNDSIAKKNASDNSAAGDEEARTSAVPAPKDLISLFLSSNIKEEEDVKGKAFDSEMHLIRDTVVNFIFAGKDTTSHNMSFFILMTNRYPEVLKKIRAELKAKLLGLFTGEMTVPSMDGLPQLTFLEAAVRENLQLNPVLPLGGRQAIRDTVLCDGTPIAKHTRVTPSIISASRNKSVWGEDALEFKPERWIDLDTGKLVVMSPFNSMYHSKLLLLYKYDVVTAAWTHRTCLSAPSVVTSLGLFELSSVDNVAAAETRIISSESTHLDMHAQALPRQTTLEDAMLSVEQLTAYAQQQTTVVLVSVVLGALLGACMLLTALTRKKNKAYVYPQPASTLPILGNTLDALVFHNGRIYDWFSDHCLAFDGPWLLLALGTVPTITISTPELFEDVMKTQFENFPKGEDETEYYSDLFGKGILASDGDVWFFHRKTASNLFSNQMMRDVMYEAVREKVQTLCHVFRTYEAKSEAASFREVMTQFTSDVFGKVGFGVDLNCLENDLAGKPGNEFIGAFAVATKILDGRFQQPKWFWLLKKRLNFGSEKVLARNVEMIDKFIFRIINESIAKKNTGSESKSSSPTAQTSMKDLISLFLSSKVKEEEDLKGKAFDSEMHLIRDMVVSFIFAGKDTTSHSMSWFLVMMNRHPEVQKKVCAELKEKLPGLVSGEATVPSLDDLSQLTYLEATIRENLRLNPVLPISARQASKDTVLCDGTPIPKDTRIAIGMYASARKTSIWGDDALEFKPERWIDSETGKLLVVSPFKSMFFFGGPRQCIGMKFAMMELKSTLAVLFSTFDLKTVEDPWKITYEAALTMAVKGQLLVQVTSLAGGLTTEVAPSA